MRKDIVGHLEVSVILPKYSNTIVKPSHIIFNGLEHIRQYISVFISKELPPEFSALTLHWPDWDFPPKLLPYVRAFVSQILCILPSFLVHFGEAHPLAVS